MSSRLACRVVEERLFARLEEQHKSEIEIYRGEMTKWQSEADELRKQLSENRMLITKENISLMKDMQEKDERIQQLSFAYQELQVSLFVTNSLGSVRMRVFRYFSGEERAGIDGIRESIETSNNYDSRRVRVEDKRNHADLESRSSATARPLRYREEAAAIATGKGEIVQK